MGIGDWGFGASAHHNGKWKMDNGKWGGVCEVSDS